MNYLLLRDGDRVSGVVKGITLEQATAELDKPINGPCGTKYTLRSAGYRAVPYGQGVSRDLQMDHWSGYDRDGFTHRESS